MSTFDPGPGWRRVGPNEVEPTDETIVHRPAGGIATPLTWVREVPVPALPTAPYTVIRVTWARGPRAGVDDALIRMLGGWCDTEGTNYAHDITNGDITGFEVLSEPRAVTAKAILDRLHELMGRTDDSVLRYGHFNTLEQEFGVES